MVLKWVSALGAAVALGIFATANLTPGIAVPFAADLLLVAASATGLVLVVLAELYQRLDARLGEIAERLEIQRGLAELLSRTDAAVVPIAPRRSGR